jgi:hypothetical protein
VRWLRSVIQCADPSSTFCLKSLKSCPHLLRDIGNTSVCATESIMYRLPDLLERLVPPRLLLAAEVSPLIKGVVDGLQLASK